MSNDLSDFDDEEKQIIEEAKRYLSLRNPNDDVMGWSDDRVLKAVNRCYFGGIQRFAKYHKEKRGH